MRRYRATGILLTLFCAIIACSTGITAYGDTESPELVPLRRFAFIVGSNEGGGCTDSPPVCHVGCQILFSGDAGDGRLELG